MFIKKNFFSILVYFCLFTSGILAYQEMIIKDVKVEWVIGTKPVRVIKVVLDGQDFIVNSLATTGWDSLKNLMDKVGWHTAINGIFFCPANYSYCNGKTFSNFERVFNGEVDEQSRFWPDTGVRGIFGFEKNGTPLFVQNNLSEMPGIWIDTNKERIDELYFGLGNFPILVHQGENVVQHSVDYLDRKLSGRQNRHFICSSKDNTTIYMGVIGGVNMYEAADIMIKQFDCRYGLNLDAGSSANMIYQDKLLQKNSENIMDARVVVDRDTYKDLTNSMESELPELNPYLPEDHYILSEKQQKKIEALDYILPEIIEQQWSTFKWDLIRLARKIASTPEVEHTPEKKIFFNKLLITLFSIGN